MSNRSEALEFLNLLSQYRQEGQLAALRASADQATAAQEEIQRLANRQAELEQEREHRQDRVEAIRQRVLRANQGCDILAELTQKPEYQAHDLADYVAFAARSVGVELQTQGVASENVPEYADKERIEALYARLSRMYNTARASLPPQRQSELDLSFRYHEEIPGLQRIIELEAQVPQIEAHYAALASLQQQQQQAEAQLARAKLGKERALGFGLFLLAVALGFCLMAMAPGEGADAKAPPNGSEATTSSEPAAGGHGSGFKAAACGPLALLSLCASGACFVYVMRGSKETQRSMQAQIASVQAEIGKLKTHARISTIPGALDMRRRELLDLRGRFGTHTPDELRQMVEEREALIDSFQKKVDFEELDWFNTPDSTGSAHPAPQEPEAPPVIRTGVVIVAYGPKLPDQGRYATGATWDDAVRKIIFQSPIGQHAPDKEDLQTQLTTAAFTGYSFFLKQGEELYFYGVETKLRIDPMAARMLGLEPETLVTQVVGSQSKVVRGAQFLPPSSGL